MTEKLIIIDYGSGNLRSAEKAFERAAMSSGTFVDVSVSSDPDLVRAADRIILPGVGAFGECGRGLRAIDGMVEALEEAVLQKAKPFLGICVGMQLMATTGIEHGHHKGLGWIDASVIPLKFEDESLKIPHMGWNEITLTEAGQQHAVAGEMSAVDHTYFVHSYHMTVANPEHILATVDYGMPLTAIVGRDNIIGFQFHPEKSQAVGLKLLEQFIRWRP
jgi:imidazole glycerol-phosphate synthase subunit HisH